MIQSSFYNQENNVLTIAWEKLPVTQTKQDGNNVLIYNNEKLIGINIFQPDFCQESGIYDVHKLPEELKSLIDVPLENPYVVGKVIELEKHPKSEKLNVCQVEIGNNETTQIVCGASNVSVGILVVVAKVGAFMPNGMYIAKNKLIDIDSHGMICSLFELGKTEQTGMGIAILEEDKYQVGADFV